MQIEIPKFFKTMLLTEGEVEQWSQWSDRSMDV